MRTRSYLVRYASLVLFALSACQLDQASLEVGDGGGMDAGMVLRSTTQALETSSLCPSMQGLQPGSHWPLASGCPGRNGQARVVAPTSAVPRWTLDTLSDVRSGVAIAADGSILFGADSGVFYRVDPMSGLARDQLLLGGAIKATPALSADTAYIPTESGKLFAVTLSDFKSKAGFPFNTGGAITSSPLILPSGNVVFGSSDTNVYAVSPTGTRVWATKTGAAVSGSAALSLDGSTVFIGSRDRYAYALNASTGAVRWKRQLPSAITTTPALTTFNLVIFTAGATVYALDATTGVIAWSKAMGSSGTATSPAITRDGVVVVGAAFGLFSGGSLQAFRPNDGTLLFRHDTLGGIETTPMIDAQSSAIFGTNNGTLHSVNAAGRAIFTHTLPGGVLAGVKGSPVLSAHGITVGCDDNKLHHFSGSSALLPAGAACQTDSQCAPTLLCGADNGPRFGEPSGGACAPAACFNKILDPGEIEPDCGGQCGTCSQICSQSCTAGSQVTPPALEVLSFSKGAFSRGSEATYQTSANTLAVARGDLLRYEDRGDGYGRVALFEGARTNRIVWSEQVGHTPEWWTGVAQTPTMILTEDTTVSPTGVQTADRWQAQASGNASRAQTIVNAMPAGSLSAWLRLTDPASFNQANPLKTRAVLTDLTGGWYNEASDWSLPAAWERRSMTTKAVTKSTAVQMSHKGAWPGTAAQFPALPAADFAVFGWQLEESVFPSSYIPTQESALTRKVDLAVFATSDVPAWLRTGKWQIDVLPLYSSAEIATTDDFVLLAWEGGQLSLAKDATGGLVKLVSGTTTARRTIAWRRNQKLTLTVDGTAKTFQVGGATTGDGSQSYGSFAIATGRVGVGALLNGTKPAFARISEIRKVGSATVACVPDPDCIICGDGTISGSEVCDPGADFTCNSTCSQSGDPQRCATGADCGPGQTCGLRNGALLGLEPSANVCWAGDGCRTATPPRCGEENTPCGACQCVPNCANKVCGSDPSDGCGGICTGFCPYQAPNCKLDSDCRDGQVCGIGAGVRFGYPVGTNICWSSGCSLPSADECGQTAAECGLCDTQCVPKCAGKACGESDGCGGMCTGNAGTCAGGGFCDGLGQCVNPILKGRDAVIEAKAHGLPAGSFRVTPSGTGSYTIPIEVPPGSAGLTPELSLVYNSNAPNGYLGRGWSIGGISSISLCPYTVRHNGFAAGVRGLGDQFCLDGKPLVAVTGRYGADGTEYRTSLDSFVKVVSHGAGPDSFTVHSKDGTRREYGGYNSSVYIDRTSKFARAWRLDRVVSSSGVLITYFYKNETVKTSLRGRTFVATNEHYLTGISYGSIEQPATAPVSARFVPFYVVLNYQAANDHEDGYIYGAPMRRTRRLASVSTHYLGDLIREYRLSYSTFRDGTSKLDSVQECAGRGVRQSCKAPTRFHYDDHAGSTAGDYYDTARQVDGGFVPAGTPVHVLDANGDGRDDVAYVNHDGDWVLAVTGENGQIGRPLPLKRARKRASWVVAATGRGESVYGSEIPREHVGDYDGDGRDEIIEVDATGSFQMYSFGANNTLAQRSTGITIVPFQIKNMWSYDADGDGDSDLLVCHRSGAKSTQKLIWWKNNKGTFSKATSEIALATVDCALSARLDVNGDEVKDLVLYSSSRVPSSLLSITVNRSGELEGKALRQTDGEVLRINGISSMVELDANGDRLTDLLVRTGGNKTKTRLLMNVGLEGIFREQSAQDWIKVPSYTADGFLPLDFDDDGRFDVGVYNSTIPYPTPLVSEVYRSSIRKSRSYEDCTGIRTPSLYPNLPPPSDIDFGVCRRIGGTVSCTGCPIGNERVCVEAGSCSRTTRGCDAEVNAAIAGGALVEPGDEALSGGRAASWSRYCVDRAGRPYNEAQGPTEGQETCDAAKALLACQEHNAKVDAAGGESLSPSIDLTDLQVTRNGAEQPGWRSIIPADIDGDGHQDLVAISEYGNLHQIRRRPTSRNLRRITQQANTFSDGEVNTRIDYASGLGAVGQGIYKLNSAAVSRCARDGQLCNVKVGWPLVSAVSVASLGRFEKHVYRYEDSVSDTLHGWLGFSVTDDELYDPSAPSQVLYTNRTLYAQATTKLVNSAQRAFYPFVGLATGRLRQWKQAKTALSLDNDVTYVEGTFTQFKTMTSVDGLSFVYPETMLGIGQNMGARNTFRVDWSRTLVVDGYGNPDLVTTRYPDEGRVVTSDSVYEYTPTRRATWQVGLVDHVTTQDNLGSRTLTRTAKYTYDALGRVKTAESQKNEAQAALTTEYGYDGYGNVNSITERDLSPTTPDRVTSLQYGGFGAWVHKTTTPEGLTTTTEHYAVHGALARSIDPNGVTQEWDYDAFGHILAQRQKQTADATTSVLTTTYDWHQVGPDRTERGLVLPTAVEVTRQLPDMSKDSTAFDVYGNALRKVWPDARGVGVVRQETELDPLGRVKAAFRPHRPGTVGAADDQGKFVYTRDPVGRVIAERAPSYEQQWQFAALEETEFFGMFDGTTPGRYVVRGTDPKGGETNAIVDAQGRPIWVRDAKLGVTTYSYGAGGGLSTVRDAKGNVTKIESDNFGRKASLVDPDTGTHSYAYDAFGQLRSHVNNTVPTTFAYDRMGRMLTRTTRDGVATWVWDQGVSGKGKLAYHETTEHRRSYTYEAPFGLLDTVTDTVELSDDSVSLVSALQYDGQLRPKTLTYPSGLTIEYGYSPSGTLTSVKNLNENRGIWAATDFYQGYALKNEAFQNGVKVTYDYKHLSGQLLSTAATGSGGSSFRNTFGYDQGDQNLASVTYANGQSQTYEYDELNRLTSVSSATVAGTTPLEGYTYDALGNIESGALGAYTYSPNPMEPAYAHTIPHATRGAGGNTYGYDNRGNQVWRAGPNIRGARQNLTYNSLNQLTRIQSGGGVTGAPANVMDFAYDAEGGLLLARKGDSETVFVEKLYKQHREAGELVEEAHTIMVEGRPVAEISRDAVSGTWTTSYVHTDRLGSAEWLSNAQGALSRGTKYGAFGQLKEAGGQTEIGYTGHLDLAEFGLVHAGGRVYDPELARFLSADPFVRSALNSQSLNRYSYVENNPMNAVDPSGLQVVIPIFGGRSCGPNLKQCHDSGESESSVLPNPYITVSGDSDSGSDDGWSIIDEVHGEIWSPNNAPETPPAHAPAPPTPSAVSSSSALPDVGPAAPSSSGGRHYTEAQTRGILEFGVADYRDGGSGNPLVDVEQLLRAWKNHTYEGQYDFKVNQKDDTFTVDGNILKADEFGNYVAGYLTYSRFGTVGEALTRAGGHAFELLDSGTLDDPGSTEFISRGIYDYQRSRWTSTTPNISRE